MGSCFLCRSDYYVVHTQSLKVRFKLLLGENIVIVLSILVYEPMGN